MKSLLFLLAIVSPQLLFAEVTIQGQPDDARAFLQKNEARVTLRGQSSMVVEATEIKAYVEVTSEGASYGSAIDVHEQQKQDLVTKLEAVGIPRGLVKIPKFATVSPKHAGSSGQVVSYTAQSTLTILLQEQKQYVELLGLLDKVRQAKLQDLAYNHTLLTELHKQILTNACKSVMTRKEVYEQSLGVSLRPISFVEEEGSERPDRFDRNSFGQIPIKAAVQVIFAVISSASSSPAKPTASPTPGAVQ